MKKTEIEFDREQLRRFYDQTIKTEKMAEFDELPEDTVLILAQPSVSFAFFVLSEEIEQFKESVLNELKRLRKKVK